MSMSDRGVGLAAQETTDAMCGQLRTARRRRRAGLSRPGMCRSALGAAPPRDLVRVRLVPARSVVPPIGRCHGRSVGRLALWRPGVRLRPSRRWWRCRLRCRALLT
jgi:hypothetical protein